LAPSYELRRWFGHHPDRWEGFMKLYRAELEEGGKAEDLQKIGRRATERNVTLLSSAKDAKHNNARALGMSLATRMSRAPLPQAHVADAG